MAHAPKSTLPDADTPDGHRPVRVEKHVRIPMPDGVHLCADMVIPDAPGPFPAVFDYYPYRKDDLSAGALRRQVYLAQHGYAALRVDVRGTGSSEGVAEDEYVLQEQLDGVAIIDWLANQPWCTGEVGMFGTSYGGFNSLQVAMHRPPALKAICPMYYTDNRYTDDCHYKGGALQMLYDMATYGLSMVVENALPPYPEACGPRWAETWEEHLQAEPWLLNWLENQTYNDYWKHGSLCENYAAVECAVYLIGGWRDGYTNCNLRTFAQLNCPKKVIVGPWLHSHPDVGVPGPRIDHLYEMVRFFDHWLKGIDNGVMDEPPITLYVQTYDEPIADRALTSGFWRHESEWPMNRLEEQTLYLSGEGGLEAEAPQDEASLSYTYNPTVGTAFPMFSAASPYLLPVDQRLEMPYMPVWQSAPLEEPLEIVGQPEATLFVATTTDVATVVMRLMDIAPDGTAALITKGVLNLTHHDSHEEPSPAVPGEVYEIALPLDATAWQFPAGHRIAVGVSGADFPNTWPSPKPYTATLWLGGKRPARLALPVAGLGADPLPDPALRPPAPFEPIIEGFWKPDVWRVTRDPIARRTEVYLRTAGTAHVDPRLWFTSTTDTTAAVYEDDPARATISSTHQIVLHWPERVIDTRARGQIESTVDALHVTVHLNIEMDGQPHLHKSWVRTIPRRLL
jgi:putative CocE/NonD family hydrolase